MLQPCCPGPCGQSWRMQLAEGTPLGSHHFANLNASLRCTPACAGAVSVPVFQLINGWTAWQTLRRAAFAFFGIANGTEFNEAFEDTLREALAGSREAVFVCQIGGTLTPTDANPFGRQSRSLIAAYAADLFGIKQNIKVLDGGMAEWVRAERPVTRD